MTVAIVTDSGSDLSAEQLREHGIRQVPLTVSFGDESYLSPDELPSDVFWEKLSAPGAPFPTTAAPSAGAFKRTFEDAFAAGADSIVYVGLSDTLSATLRSGQMAAEMLPDREIHVVDSRSACMGIGVLALRAAAMAEAAVPAAEIAAELTRLRAGVVFFVALETLDYLKRGGRISPARAAIGSLLSVKPIMTIDDGIVIPADRPRTRARARERLIELMTACPVTALNVCYTPPLDPDPLREELLARMPGPQPSLVTTHMIGPVIGTHIGPGSYGGVLLREP